MQEGMLTPWGVALMVHALDDGISWVQTAEHGGLLLEQTQAEELLSPKARTLGTWWHEFLTFEQDDALLVVFMSILNCTPGLKRTLFNHSPRTTFVLLIQTISMYQRYP